MKKSKITPFILFSIILLLLSNNVKGQSAQIWKERDRLSSIKNSRELINSMNRIGMLYQAKDVDSCFYFGLKTKALSVKIGYTKGEIDADNLIGVALSLRGLYKESLEKFSDVLERYQQQGDTENTVQVLMNMGLVYGDLAENLQFRHFFQKAISAGSKLKKDSIMSMVYVNYALLESSLSDDSLNYYLNKSRKIAKKYKSDWVHVMIMQVEANRMIRNGNEHVFPLLQKISSKAKQLSLEILEVNSLILLGNYYINEPIKALKYYQMAYDLTIATGNKNTLIPAAATILKTTQLIGNITDINRAHELMENALIKENENLKKFIGDYVKYNSLEENNRLLKIHSHDQRTKIWMLIFILTISALLTFFIYRQYKASSRLNQKISEQNNSLQKALTALEESQEENTRMMKIVAHDLRNPIGAIKMAASLIIKKDVEHNEDNKMLNMIVLSADKSLELVGDLLSSHTKLDNIRKEQIDLQALLHYCVNILKHKAIEKGQHIKLTTLPITLLASREKLWRVISNLIANAIKFSPIDAIIRINIEVNDQKVRVAVIDNGIGIPDEMKNKIFDMFTEAKRTGTAGEQPFGLGLAISKQIIEAHGGNIWFDSKPGIGTTFWVELPLS